MYSLFSNRSTSIKMAWPTMGPQLRWAIPTSRLLGWSWLHLGLFQTGTQGCWCFNYNQTQQISHNDEDTQIWQNWVTACNSLGSNMKGSPNDKHKAEGSRIVTSSAPRPQPIKRPSFFLRKNDLSCSDWAIFQTGSLNRSRFGASVVARPYAGAVGRAHFPVRVSSQDGQGLSIVFQRIQKHPKDQSKRLQQ